MPKRGGGVTFWQQASRSVSHTRQGRPLSNTWNSPQRSTVQRDGTGHRHGSVLV